MQDYRKLHVWEKSHRLAVTVYMVTRCFPREEMYGLISQIRRAAMSIPANIAGGCGRGGQADTARFLQVDMGSACEVEYYALLAHDLTFLDAKTHQQVAEQVSEVKRMLASLIQKMRSAESADRSLRTANCELRTEN